MPAGALSTIMGAVDRSSAGVVLVVVVVVG